MAMRCDVLQVARKMRVHVPACQVQTGARMPARKKDSSRDSGLRLGLLDKPSASDALNDIQCICLCVGHAGLCVDRRLPRLWGNIGMRGSNRAGREWTRLPRQAGTLRNHHRRISTPYSASKARPEPQANPGRFASVHSLLKLGFIVFSTPASGRGQAHTSFHSDEAAP